MKVVSALLDLLESRSTSLRSIYCAKVEQLLARDRTMSNVTEGDLDPLPPLVQTYLRRVGVVGRPHVQNFRAVFRGRMKAAANAAWMPIEAQQVEDFEKPARLFFMTASRSGIPFVALHVYEGSSASMRVKVASLFDMVDARGPEMDRSETVTLFNDMCLLAPASLLDAKVTWRTIDEHSVGATFRNGPIYVSAKLVFDAAGDLVNFISTDRDQSADGKVFRRLSWSTPIREYRDLHGQRVAAVADATWTEPGGEWTYASFEVVSIEYNVANKATALRKQRRAAASIVAASNRKTID